MSHYMTALAMKQEGIKPAAKIVLYWLADHYNGETGLCFPSLKTLERECEMSRPAIIRHLLTLENAGLISRNQRTRANGSQTSTAYSLHLTPVTKCNSPSNETSQPPVTKRDPHNLGILNLGIEPDLEANASMQSVAPDIDEIAKAVSAYNATAARVGWPSVQKLTPARRAAVRGRLKDAGGAEGWEIALAKAEASPFLRGERGGFSCTFDFLSKQANFTKLMEGNYDERDNSKASDSRAHATTNAINVAGRARRAPSADSF